MQAGCASASRRLRRSSTRPSRCPGRRSWPSSTWPSARRSTRSSSRRARTTKRRRSEPMVRATRSRSLASFVNAQVARGTGFATNMGRIYGLGLLLLAMVFFMVTFRGRAPKALEKVFPATADDTVLEQRRKDLATLVGGAWLDPADGTGFAETPGYRRLIQMLNDHVRPGDVVEDPPLFNRELAMRAPDLQRGEVVKVRGYVAGHWAEKLDQRVFEVTDVWRVFLTDSDGEDGIVVDVIMPQPP